MRLVVGMPCSGEMRVETAISLMSAFKQSEAEGENLSFHPRLASVPSQNQNKIVELALVQGADAVMLVDSDMAFPPETFGRLIGSGAQVIGVPYRLRSPPYSLALGLLPGVKEISTTTTGCYRCRFVPSGLLMVRRKVFETMPYPWFEEAYGDSPDDLIGHDVNFCLKADALGFPVYADMDLAREVYHIGTVALGLAGAKE